jgi:hypothetical protein
MKIVAVAMANHSCRKCAKYRMSHATIDMTARVCCQDLKQNTTHLSYASIARTQQHSPYAALLAFFTVSAANSGRSK